MKKLMVAGETLCLVEDRYVKSGRLAIELYELEDGKPISPYCHLTVNVPEEKLAKGEFFVRLYAEHSVIAEEALASGWFVDTGKRVFVGPYRSVVAVWKYSDATSCKECGFPYERHGDGDERCPAGGTRWAGVERDDDVCLPCRFKDHEECVNTADCFCAAVGHKPGVS